MKNYFLLAALACAGMTVSAQSALTTKKLTIYKNGTALVSKEGTLNLKNGSALLPIPAQALYGTYWLGSGKDNPVKHLQFRNDTLKTNKRCATVAQFLAGNVGKQATIYYKISEHNDKVLSGIVAEYYQPTGMVKIKNDKGSSWLNTSMIYQVEFKENENLTYLEDSVARMTVLQATTATEKIALQEFYMQQGMNWIPSYFLKLKDDKNARLEMKATIENFNEAINNAETELVVGSPNLHFGKKLDPMAYDYLTVDNVYGDGGANYGNARVQYKTMNMAMDAEAAVPAFNYNFETEGEKSNDLYIYKLGKISLPKDGKGNFPIFAKELEYKDKYEGTIPDYVNFFSTRYVNPEESTYDVFHSLEIKNTSGVPFTTAPIMVLNEKDQFLAQDELKYTPNGSNTNVRLSKAIDITMKCAEEEKSKNDNEKKIGKVVYGKVVLKGTITVDNFQDKEVTISITKNLLGEILSQSDNGKVTKKKNYYNNMNASSEVKWEVTLKGNSKKTITYEYEVFYNM
jgi:hypothetical protein